MLQTISATTARDNFADIINKAMYAGQEYIVVKQGKPAVLITPAQKSGAVKARGAQFLLKLAEYNLKGAPKDLAKNHDKYIWE